MSHTCQGVGDGDAVDLLREVQRVLVAGAGVGIGALNLVSMSVDGLGDWPPIV